MEQTVIKIKCPCCGAILAVKRLAGIEQKNIVCPVCRESSAFTAFRQVVDMPHENTRYPDEEKTRPNFGEETDLGDRPNLVPGVLRVMSASVPEFRLKTGRNVIGRASSASTADFRIPTPESNRMSREHLVIEVKKVPGKGLVHYASLYKQRVNDTRINGERLEYGDCVVLHDGDTLRLPDAVLRFEIPDDRERKYDESEYTM